MADSFDTWLAGLPKWLQTAAANLLNSQKRPDEGEVAALADLCVSEQTGGSAHFTSVPVGAFGTPASGAAVRIRSIGGVTGVNALDAKAALDFGDASLGVVYGHNGTGKSGFARLTKHAANTRVRSEILADVFVESGPECGADFVIERGGVPAQLRWEAKSGPLPPLKHLHVFDTDVARFYITEKAEASYEPRRLRFLTSLVEISDRVKAELQRRKDALPSRLPAIPVDRAATQLASFLNQLSAKVSSDAVKKKLARDKSHVDRATALQEALKAPDHATRIEELKKALTGLDSLVLTLTTLKAKLTPEHIEKVAAAGASAAKARKAATQAAAQTFEHALLPGVGEAPWQAMWEAARTYATTVAYPTHAFPHVDDALCPLCQQGLAGEAHARMVSFDTFVTGEIERKAKVAEAAYAGLVGALPSLPPLVDWLSRFSVIPAGEEAAATLHAAAYSALVLLRTSVDPADVGIVDFTAVGSLVEAHRASLNAEKALLTTAQDAGGRAKLEAELLELRMLEWCNENLQAILDELERRKTISILDGAQKRTSTTSITKKKNELAEDELTGGYQQRFREELMALGAGRIPVKPVSASGVKGQVKFSLSIDGGKRAASPAQVLSEGEARIVALAAFLADVTVAGARTPFVFDDPISSLDIEFEERVVERLLALSKVRQVIVFTHRLSLVTLLNEAVKKENTASKRVDGVPSLKLKVVTLRRIEGRIGLVTDTNVLESKVDKALNQILSPRLTTAKKLADTGDVEAFCSAMKAICSDIRILAERAVEEELLSSVVLRFRRSVVTKDKLSLLAKINAEDCAFIDGLMTRFSAFEHSQPAELPAPMPSHAEVVTAAEALRNWVVEFRGRGARA
jgi:energy-coupling factor transporter ATP-binding protein EcfA2